MASNRAMTPSHRPRARRVLALALAVLLSAVAAAPAQEAPRSRAQDVLKQAVDTYKRGDYELAATLFNTAQQGRDGLSASDQLDLDNFSAHNRTALQARKEGAATLREAEAALNQGRPTDANKLLKSVVANAYLSLGDRQLLANLTARLQPLSVGPPGGPAKDAKTLLVQARAAFQAGQFDQAESLANQAEKLGTGSAWLQPWADTPAKVRRDVQVARAKQENVELLPARGPQSPYAVGGTGPGTPVKTIASPSAPVTPQPAPLAPPTAPSSANVTALVQASSAPPALPPIAGAPSTPTPLTPAPLTPMPMTPAPLTPAPLTPAPLVPTAVKSADAGAVVQVGAQVPAPALSTPAPAVPSGLGAPPPVSTPAVDMPPPPSQSQLIPPLPPPTRAANPAPASSTPDPHAKATARNLLNDGYKALDAGDFETARLMAYRVRDLKLEFAANERSPELLLQAIDQRVSLNAKSKTPKVVLDPRALVKEGRALLAQHKLDEAEVKCSQAASVKNAHWGLFEYSPDQLRAELLRARAVDNREQSVKLLAEARQLFNQGDYEDAKKKAWRAQELHGQYSPFDFGDRPQRLLAEIAKVETSKPAAPKTIAKAPAMPANGQTQPDAPNMNAGARSADPISVSARARALTLLAEARDLDRRGQLAEAQQKLQEARKLGVQFAPGEESPDAVQLSLAGHCRSQIQLTLQQVTEAVSAKPGDVARLQKAQQDLANARQLAVQFGLDSAAIDQKSMWVQQAALTAGAGALANAPAVVQTQYQTAANGNPDADAKHKEGLDKLERARLELRSGSCTTARRLAEEAFNPAYGVQKEAEFVLRDIDAEEHNQRLLAAQRTFDKGVDCYLHGDFKQATSILAHVELNLLAPQHQQRLREIMSTREMQAPATPTSNQKVQLTQLTEQAPGQTSSGPGTGGDDPLGNIKAMEQIQYQQMAQRNAQAQKSALELFKAGQKMKAVELLTDQLSQIELLAFSPDVNRSLRTPLERRLSEFRTVMAQDLLTNQRQNNKAMSWDENKYQADVRKRQDEVADLMKQCSALDRDGKYKESLALAYKVREIDPDNVAAGIAIQMLNTQMAIQRSDRTKDEVEDYFLKELTYGPGPRPTDDNVFPMSPSALKRLEMRSKNTPTSIVDQLKSPKERAIQYRLEQPIHFGFVDTPLKSVIDTLSKLSNVPIYEDTHALQAASIGMDSPLTMECNGLSMKSALNILLNKMRLTYVIKDEALMITSIDSAHNNFKRAVYPVGDLIVPVEDHPLDDVFNLTKVLEQQMRSLYPMQSMMNYAMAPLASQGMSMPANAPISSYGGGLGSAFASSGASQTQPGMGNNPVQRRAPRQTMEDLLMDLIKGTIAPSTWKEMGGPGTVQYYPLGMALVINQAQEVQEDVENLLKALRRLQDMEVAIEMRLVLVSESFYERIGVDFNVNIQTPASAATQADLLNSSFQPFGTINKQFNFNNVVTGLTTAGTLTPDLGIPIKNSSFNFSVPPFGGYTAPGLDGGLSLGLAFLSEIQVFMILEAAQADSRTNIMMAPKITVFNGQAANITVNVTQFINTGITPSPVLNGAGLNTAALIFQPNNTPFPIGTTLQVIPVVSADRRFVRINLAPQITNFVDGNVIPLFQVQVPVPNLLDGPLGIGIPTGQPQITNTFNIQQPRISNISLNTTVNVPDGGTVLLGGIKVMSEGRNEAGPPILSKIPYLDRLFRNVGYGRDSQSLMLMVTPRIIINEEEELIFTGQVPPIPRP